MGAIDTSVVDLIIARDFRKNKSVVAGGGLLLFGDNLFA